MIRTKKLLIALLTICFTFVLVVAGLLLSNPTKVYAETESQDTVSVNGYLEFGNNAVVLTAGVAQYYQINSINPGIYEFYWQAGDAVLVFPNIGSYTLNDQNYYFRVELEDPENTLVTFLSYEDCTLEFGMMYTLDLVNLVIGSNSVELSSEPILGILQASVSEEGKHLAPTGYYTFERISGNAYFVFNDYLNCSDTYYLNTRNTSFTVYVFEPWFTTIKMYSTSAITVSFNITYSETNQSVLNVGQQTVDASGDGIEYIFTSENGGYYSLDCDDDNAYIYFETEYGADRIEPLPYIFSLSAGETITFFMATEDWSDSTYIVTLTEIEMLSVGIQTVNATCDGIAYVFTSDNGGAFTLNCTYSNAYITVKTDSGQERILWGYDDSGEWVYESYAFTLKAGEAIIFYMLTDDSSSSTYEIIISKVS